jgi:hypothetical protein
VREAKHAVYLGKNPRDYTNKEKLLQVRLAACEMYAHSCLMLADSADYRPRQYSSIAAKSQVMILAVSVWRVKSASSTAHAAQANACVAQAYTLW